MESIILAHLALCTGSVLFVGGIVLFDHLQAQRDKNSRL